MSDEPQTIYLTRWALNSEKIIRARALPMPADPSTMVVVSGRLRGQHFNKWDWEPSEEKAREAIKKNIREYIASNNRRNAQLEAMDFDKPEVLVDGDTAEITVVMA
jgi:hypothetical protein